MELAFTMPNERPTVQQILEQTDILDMAKELLIQIKYLRCVRKPPGEPRQYSVSINGKVLARYLCFEEYRIFKYKLQEHIFDNLFQFGKQVKPQVVKKPRLSEALPETKSDSDEDTNPITSF